MKTLKILLEEKGFAINIINKLKSIDGIQISNLKITQEEINIAQQKLQIKFPEDYKNILLKIGSFKVYDFELTTIQRNIIFNDIQLNFNNNDVTALTLSYRKIDNFFPLDCFVLEDFNNNMLTLCNESSNIFEYIADVGFNDINSKKSIRKICDSLTTYIDIRLNEEMKRYNEKVDIIM